MDKVKKDGRYNRVYQQLVGLIDKSNDPYARMATISSVLHHKMDHFFWTGFYLLTSDGRLVVRNYQGPIACMELKKNTGVCWASVQQEKTIVVPDVHQFPGHIACDSRSNSEIVVPLRNNEGSVVGVLDIDSTLLANFDEIDARWLEKIVELIGLNKITQALVSNNQVPVLP
jgi:L-methionine (R)-S-oxide reductase